MKKMKVSLGVALLAFSALAVSATWYGLAKVRGTWATDSDAEFTMAAAAFRQQYTGAAMTDQIKAGDVIDMQYSDGTIVEFTLFDNWKTSMATWSPDVMPKVRQGPWAKSKKTPVNLTIKNGTSIPVVLTANPTATTQTWSLTIVQSGGGCDGCTSTGGGGGGGGGGGAPRDPTPPPCPKDCSGEPE
jgi:hypothetical protein